jgi:hypothetical protein
MHKIPVFKMNFYGLPEVLPPKVLKNRSLIGSTRGRHEHTAFNSTVSAIFH